MKNNEEREKGKKKIFERKRKKGKKWKKRETKLS